MANSSPRYLVTRIEEDPGCGQPTIITDYEYANGMYYTGYPHERTDLGFEWIKKVDKSNTATHGTYVKTFYRQDKPFQYLVSKEELRDSTDKPYRISEYFYDKIENTTNTAIKFIFKTDEWVKNYDGTGNCTTYHTKYFDAQHPGEYYNTINPDGNLKKIVAEGNVETNTDDETIITVYAGPGTRYVFSPAMIQKLCTNLDGQTNRLAGEERYLYDDSAIPGYIDKGRLTRKEIENGNHDIALTYEYDSYGSIFKTWDGKATAGEFDEYPGYAGFTGKIEYDNVYKTYPEKTTDALNRVSVIVYDDLKRPRETKDVNGVSSHIVYDSFGRIWKKIAPGDSVNSPTTQTDYYDTATPYCIKTSDKIQEGDILVTYTYLDGLGRIIQEKLESASGWITKDNFYDAAGRCYKTSVPYFSQDSAYSTPEDRPATSNEYDAIGRIVLTTTPEGTSTSTEYRGPVTVTYDPEGHKSEREVIGNITYSRSYKGTSSYVLYTRTIKQSAFDGMKITDNNGNILRTYLDGAGRKTRYDDPDMGTWYYSYDDNGNLLSQTDAKGQTVSMTYDCLNRITGKDYPGTFTDTVFSYDEEGHGASKGRLTTVTYAGGSDSYTYDDKGRVTIRKKTIAGNVNVRQLAYEYYSNDTVKSITYPGGETVEYAIDEGAQVSEVAGDSDYVTGISYTALNKVSSIAYGNGITTAYDYYDSSTETDQTTGTTFSYRLKSMTLSTPGYLSMSYRYDKAGNIRIKTDNNLANRSETYVYDDLYRLQTASAGDATYGTRSYSYNEINNIVTKEGKTYTYGSARPHAVTNDGTYTYTYDDNGNMETRSDGTTTTTYGYDPDNRLVSITGATTDAYVYDSGTARVKKTEGNKTTYYFFPEYEEEYTDSTLTKSIKYYFVNEQRVAERSSLPEEGLRYYHADHLGSSVRMTDENGSLVRSIGYMPFGGTWYSDGEAKYQYTGKEKDASGLYYYGARYYNPELGRFISPDPILDGLNRYAYCRNNPINYNDPSGLYGDYSDTKFGRREYNDGTTRYLPGFSGVSYELIPGTNIWYLPADRNQLTAGAGAFNMYLYTNDTEHEVIKWPVSAVACGEAVRQGDFEKINGYWVQTNFNARFQEVNSKGEFTNAILDYAMDVKATGSRIINRISYIGHGFPVQLSLNYDNRPVQSWEENTIERKDMAKLAREVSFRGMSVDSFHFACCLTADDARNCEIAGIQQQGMNIAEATAFYFHCSTTGYNVVVGPSFCGYADILSGEWVTINNKPWPLRINCAEPAISYNYPNLWP